MKSRLRRRDGGNPGVRTAYDKTSTNWDIFLLGRGWFMTSDGRRANCTNTDTGFASDARQAGTCRFFFSCWGSGVVDMERGGIYAHVSLKTCRYEENRAHVDGQGLYSWSYSMVYTSLCKTEPRSSHALSQHRRYERVIVQTYSRSLCTQTITGRMSIRS